jgi:hypothetical protein
MELDTSKAILVWAWDDAPKELARAAGIEAFGDADAKAAVIILRNKLASLPTLVGLVRQLRDARDLDDIHEAVEALCTWLDEHEKKR